MFEFPVYQKRVEDHKRPKETKPSDEHNEARLETPLGKQAIEDLAASWRLNSSFQKSWFIEIVDIIFCMNH